FSPDGRRLLSVGDNEICLWEAGTWKEMRRIHQPDGFTNRLAFSSDGKTLASGSNNGKVRLWDLNRGTKIGSFGSELSASNALAISPDGALLAANQQGVVVWNLATGKELYSVKERLGQPVWLEYPAFSPDGRTLALVAKK